MANNTSASTNCPDCGAKPGKHHKEGCDVERCMKCGGQLLSCDCNTVYIKPKQKDREKWTGKWPGLEEARSFGFFCYLSADGWRTCNKTDPGASPDLNRLIQKCTWNPKTRKWEKR